MRNQEIASIFYEIADLLDAQGVKWEPIAYRKAARSLESLPEPIEDVYSSGGKENLMEIEGVGKAMADHIEEILKTGNLRKLDDLKAKIPEGVLQMMQIEGLGPKKAMILYKKLKIKSLSDLKKAIKEQKIRKLEGFRIVHPRLAALRSEPIPRTVGAVDLADRAYELDERF